MSETLKIGHPEILDMRLVLLRNFSVVDEINLTDKFINFTLSQSIMSDSITFNIYVGDGLGHLTNFGGIGLQAREFVFVKFRSPPSEGFQSEIIDLQFAVTNISNIDASNFNQSSTFLIECRHVTSMLDMNTSVNQSFVGTYSQVASNIFDSYVLKSKYFKNNTFRKPKIEIDHSENSETFIIPGLQPLEALEFCARRSYSSKYRASLFLFYQRQDTFCYHNIERLIEDGVKNPNKKIYEYTQNRSITNQLHKKINKLEIISLNDNMNKIVRGAYKNQVRSVDLINQTYFDVVYNYKDEFNDYVNLDYEKIVDDDYLDNIIGNNYEYLYVLDSSKKNQFFPNVLGKRLSYYYFLDSLRLNITIPGDTTLKPGEVIKLEVPEFSGVNDQRLRTKFKGDYFVESVHHSATKESFFTSFSCMKNGVTTGNIMGGSDV